TPGPSSISTQRPTRRRPAMREPLQRSSPAAGIPEILARLRAHRALSQAPDAELQWLIDHGILEQYSAGILARTGDPILGIYIILKGEMSFVPDEGGARRTVMGWRDGDVTGQLPYSRMTVSYGTALVGEGTEVLFIPSSVTRELPVACPHVTTVFV